MEGQVWETDPEVKAELEAMAGTAPVSDTSLSNVAKRKMKKRKSKILPKKSPKKKETTSTIASGTIDQIELLNALKQPAFTSEEKYKILEARDKLIRLRTKKNTDIASAKHIIGTCPDMCPEKERLMREVQHQVSLYEQDPGDKTMNPLLAVKQYSRSSADQEVPLPHELRPVSVLQRTMSYLLQKIAILCDNPDVNLGDWYHFLWDRTRGIRKDITQQELCCKGSVELVEQCARFHIHCSARLVAEDLSVFDQKINTENLTKCLQTLKYMYHDLLLKNEFCPDEAEFRAYVILLNLNDANFMWEVQQFRKEIQKSKEVQFALKVYSALDKNNYVRFFNLVRSTTYLNACILLRYFVQIRLQALTTIIKSHSPRSPYTQFPLQELEHILAFEGTASTIDFVEYHGLQLNETRTHAILNRKMFQMPELPYALDRAMNVIESKRSCTVGEVIRGNSLDVIDFEKYVPHDSFDANGFINISEYIPDMDLAMLQKDSERHAKAENRKTLEEKPVDVPSKSTQPSIFQTSIFALRSSSDSRSNSPMDMVDRGLEAKPEPTLFWSKADKNLKSIFAIKPDNVSPSSIFNVPKPEKPTQDQGLTSFAGHQSTSAFTSTMTTSSIFSQSSQQGIFSSSTPQLPRTSEVPAASTSSFFMANTTIPQISKPMPFKAILETPKMEQKPIVSPPSFFMPTSTIPQSYEPTTSFKSGHKLIKTASSLFAPTTTSALPKTGGFTFNLQTYTPPVGIPPENKLVPFVQQSKSMEYHARLENQKEAVDSLKQRLEEERIRLENEKKLLEERRKMEVAAAEKQEADRRRKEEEIARKKMEEEIARRKMAEELERKRIELERKRIEEERRRIEREKKLEDMRRKQREMEETRLREIKIAVSDVVAGLIVQVDISVRDDKLKKISQRIKLKKAHRCFVKWKNSVLINKRKRKAIDQWPIWANSATIQQEAAELYARNQHQSLKYMKRYRNGFAIDIPVDMEVKTNKIDLQMISRYIFSKNFLQTRTRSQYNYLKVDIFIASMSYMTTNLKWVEKVICDLFDWKDNEYELVEESKVLTNKIIYCIKRREEYKKESTDGYIFVGDDLSEEFYEDIKKIIETSKTRTELPVAILLQNDDYDPEKLDDLIDDNNYKCKVIQERYTPKILVASVENALLYIAENAPKYPPLELELLKTFLSRYLASEIWKRMTSFTKWNQPYRTCLTKPEIVINLYNEAVSRLESIVFDPETTNYPDFPEIFQSQIKEKVPIVLPCDFKYFPPFWKNDSYRGKIKRVLADITLPQFETNWPPRDVQELEIMISEFCVKFFRDPYKKIYKIIASILRNFDPVENFDEIKNVLWTEVLEVLIQEKLNEIDFSLREPFVSQTVFSELFVVYNKDDLHEYNTNMWFYVNNPIIKNVLDKSEYKCDVDVESVIDSEEEETENIDIDLDATLLDVARERFDREEKLNASRTDLREFEILMADLEQSMTIQKQISKRFEEVLTKALND